MSEKITKTNFVALLSERLNLNKQKATETLDHIVKEIIAQLKQGKSLTLPGFGTLSVKKRAARSCRNPRTGATMQLPECKVPHLKASKELKEVVNAE